ncbi:hypothetical protein [Gloeothece verrucosa]|nr:hypothetical protein [Gloeothece verrucosa]
MQADEETILKLIAHISSSEASLSTVLTALVNELQFEEIILKTQEIVCKC